MDTGIVRVYFVDLVFIGPDSAGAASASYCAEEQGMYWEYHNELYGNQGSIQSGWGVRRQLGAVRSRPWMDAGSHLARCIARDHGERISFNALQAQNLGIDRTPSFVIVGPGGVETILGNQPYAVFETAMQGLLG